MQRGQNQERGLPRHRQLRHSKHRVPLLGRQHAQRRMEGHPAARARFGIQRQPLRRPLLFGDQQGRQELQSRQNPGVGHNPGTLGRRDRAPRRRVARRDRHLQRLACGGRAQGGLDAPAPHSLGRKRGQLHPVQRPGLLRRRGGQPRFQRQKAALQLHLDDHAELGVGVRLRNRRHRTIEAARSVGRHI